MYSCPAFGLVKSILATAFLYKVLGWRYVSPDAHRVHISDWVPWSSALVGVLAMLLTLPVPTLVSKLLMATQEKKMKCVSVIPLIVYLCSPLSEKTDERVESVTQRAYHLEQSHIMTDILVITLRIPDINVIRMIKLFAWEPKVEKQIADKRETELKLIRKGAIAYSYHRK